MSHLRGRGVVSVTIWVGHIVGFAKLSLTFSFLVVVTGNNTKKPKRASGTDSQVVVYCNMSVYPQIYHYGNVGERKYNRHKIFKTHFVLYSYMTMRLTELKKKKLQWVEGT